MPQVNNIFDIFGAIILLALVAVVVRNPGIVTGIGTQFNKSLSTAVKG